jgi:arylsulfatase A-like enzyme
VGRILALGVLALGIVPAAAAEALRPHIVFVLADDLGYGDLSCYGNKRVQTPRLDRMAREGTRFTQYYCASPVCSPSRCGLITGNYPGRWKINTFLHERAGNKECEQADYLDAKAPALPRALKEAGYATAHFGKWHLGGGRDVVDAPKFATYGYDEHAGTYESPQPHPDITATNWIWSDKDKVKRWERTAFFVDKTLDFLKGHKDQPCFVNVWLDDTHTPWVPSADAKKGNTPENLKGVLIENDRQIGRLLDGLKELGIEDKTLVLFTSDNGPEPTFDGERAGGLRGSKLSLYEGGIREPFIARWPGHVPAGKVDETTVLHAVDLFPSFCALAGAALPKGLQADGEDISVALLGNQIRARTKPLFFEYGRNEKFFRYPKGADRSPNVAMRDGNWKLLVNADGTKVELYDLGTDPKETTNLAEKKPDETKKLKEAALQWRKSLP